MKRFGVSFGLFACLTLGTGSAEAGMTLCNRTSYVLYAATAALNAPNLTVKGWTRLVPGACAEAIKGDLTAQQYLLYAKTSRAHSGAMRAWSGPTNVCIKDSDFSQKVAVGARCSDGSYEVGFANVDTRRLKTWTTTFRESPDLASMPGAERAGLKRLLGDLGNKLISSDKQLDAAIAAAKARLRIAKTAPAAALFDALETEAMKVTTPVGYSVCNDTAQPVYAAIGLKSGAVFHARGWWTVAGGTCAPLITDSVAGQKIWLRVERAKGLPLVLGPVKFCVTNIEFDIQGRERCAARGLTEAGFAETHGGKAGGFVARVSATGLAK